jgi:hypothetical protein
MRWVRVLVVAGPAVVLAGLGLLHPQELTATSAPWWTTLHIVLLPIFPLLAVSLWLLLRGVPGPVAWAARIAAYGYATFYSVTDVIVGIAAGELTQFNAARGLPERGGRPAHHGGQRRWRDRRGVSSSRAQRPRWRSLFGLDTARCQAGWCC